MMVFLNSFSFSIAAWALAASGVFAQSCLPPDGGRLAVTNVMSNDTLNIRSGPSVSYSVVAVAQPDQDNLTFLGDYYFTEWECQAACRALNKGDPSAAADLRQCVASGQLWVEVSLTTGQAGWASARFLRSVGTMPEASTLENGFYVDVKPEDVVVSADTIQRMPRRQDVTRELLLFNGIRNCKTAGHVNVAEWAQVSAVHALRLDAIGVSDEDLTLIDQALTERGHYLADFMNFPESEREIVDFCSARFLLYNGL